MVGNVEVVDVKEKSLREGLAAALDLTFDLVYLLVN